MRKTLQQAFLLTSMAVFLGCDSDTGTTTALSSAANANSSASTGTCIGAGTDMTIGEDWIDTCGLGITFIDSADLDQYDSAACVLFSKNYDADGQALGCYVLQFTSDAKRKYFKHSCDGETVTEDVSIDSTVTQRVALSCPTSYTLQCPLSFVEYDDSITLNIETDYPWADSLFDNCEMLFGSD